MNKRQTGKTYEGIAAAYLTKKGYNIIENNYHCKIGEIDIIARDTAGAKHALVFIEVKYRSSNQYGFPLEAVDYQKQKKIIAVSKYYVMEKHISVTTDMRYDVIGILGNRIEHIVNAFGTM